MAYYYNNGTEFVKLGEPIHFTTTTGRYNESPYTVEDCSATIYVTTDIVKGEAKVENFIKDIEIKKKTGKKGSCMQYKFMLYYRPFVTVENYDEDCNLNADFILSIALVCYKCKVGKLIFRDHKVIAISEDERYCGEDENTKKSIWKKKSYVADCMDVDDYNPYIGATIAVSKYVRDMYTNNKDSKSHLRRLREKIDRASWDA